MTCLVCNQILHTIKSSTNYFCTNTNNELTLLNLCKYFNIPLINIDNQKLNFSDPNFEFCSECTKFVEKLHELNENLEEIKMEIIITKNCLRSKIREITPFPGYNSKNEEEMKLLKSWKHSDKNVEIIRDLIVGPRIHLKRISPAVINASSAPFPNSPTNDFIEHFEDDFVINNSSASDSEIQEDSLTEIPVFLTGDKKPQKRKYKQKRKRKTFVGKPVEIESKNICNILKSTAPTISADTRQKVLEELFPEGITAVPAFEDKPPESENDEDLESDLNEKSRPKRSSRRKFCYKVQKKNKKIEETAVKSEPNDDNSDQSSSYLMISSSSEDFDDDRDEDFVLPDDAVETLVEDKRVDARIQSSMRALGRRKSGVVPNKIQNRPKIFMEGKDQYRYGEDFRFTGNPVDGFKCNHCTSGRVFKKKSHICIHFGKVHLQVLGQFGCPTCGKMLKSRKSLECHMEGHEAGNAVICETCGKSFAGKLHLRKHFYNEHNRFTELHSLVICEFCGKSYKQKNYNTHIKFVHFKKLKFYCEFCGAAFVRNSALTSHLVMHSTDRPFSCDKCGQQFKRKKDLKGHMERHMESSAKSNNPDLQCKFCGVQYTTQHTLSRHLKHMHNIDGKTLTAAKRTKSKARIKTETVTSDPDSVTSTNANDKAKNNSGPSSNAIGENLSPGGAIEPIVTDFLNETIDSSAATADSAAGLPNLQTAIFPEEF